MFHFGHFYRIWTSLYFGLDFCFAFFINIYFVRGLRETCGWWPVGCAGWVGLVWVGVVGLGGWSGWVVEVGPRVLVWCVVLGVVGFCGVGGVVWAWVVLVVAVAFGWLVCSNLAKSMRPSVSLCLFCKGSFVNYWIFKIIYSIDYVIFCPDGVLVPLGCNLCLILF